MVYPNNKRQSTRDSAFEKRSVSQNEKNIAHTVYAHIRTYTHLYATDSYQNITLETNVIRYYKKITTKMKQTVDDGIKRR